MWVDSQTTCRTERSPHFIIMELSEYLKELRKEANAGVPLDDPRRMGAINTIFKIEYFLSKKGRT